MSRWDASCQNVRVKIWVTVEQSATNQPFRSGDGPRMVWAKGGALPRETGGEAGLAMEMATSVDKSSFFRRLQRNVTVQWENTVAPCSPIFHFHRSIVPLFHHSSQSLRITILLRPPVSKLVCVCVCVCRVEKIIHLFFFQYSLNSIRLRADPRNFEIETME